MHSLNAGTSNPGNTPNKECIATESEAVGVARDVGNKMNSGFFLRGLKCIVQPPHEGQKNGTIMYDSITNEIMIPANTPVRMLRDATLYFLACLLMGENRSTSEWYRETCKNFRGELELLQTRDHKIDPDLQSWFREREDDAKWALQLLNTGNAMALNMQYSSGEPLLFNSRAAVMERLNA